MVEVGVFRVVQEALLNVQKHARATHVDVRLEHNGEELLVRVHDDGVGMKVASQSGLSGTGTGLRSMRERAELLGGVLEVDSRSGDGTVVVLRLADTARKPQAAVALAGGAE